MHAALPSRLGKKGVLPPGLLERSFAEGNGRGGVLLQRHVLLLSLLGVPLFRNNCSGGGSWQLLPARLGHFF